VSRHRSPRGRGAVGIDRARSRHDAPRSPASPVTRLGTSTLDPPTNPLDLAAIARASGPSRRHRAAVPPAAPAGRRRHGFAAAGVTAAALAVVGPAVLQLPVQDARLALSSDSTRLGGTDAAAPAPAVSPVVAVDPGSAGPDVGAASADLIKAGDRVRRQADDAAAAERARTEAARVAAAERAEQDAAADRAARVTSCGASGDYGGVASTVQTVGNALECVFPGHELLGVGSRGNTSDHPGGYALDVMTRSGDQIADCVLENRGALGVSYVIWNQQINTGSGWEDMEDRGGDTANHRDHVHISFERGGDPDVSALRTCG
jgi:hypothetical protein